MFHPKGLFDERLVTLHRYSNSQAIILAVAVETDFADVFGGRFATVYGPESITSLRIVALYLDVIHLSLSEIPVSILQNVITDLNLSIAQNMVSSTVPIRIEEVLIFLDGLFGMPAVSFVS